MSLEVDPPWRDARATSRPARLAARVAAHGLPEADGVLRDSLLDQETWRQLVVHVQHGRVPGLLLRAITDGSLPVTEEQREEAQAMQLSASALASVLDDLLLEVTARLRGSAVDFRVLKGAAVARLDYPDPSTRTYGDVDVLVASAQIDRAVGELERAGFVRRTPQLRSGFDRRFGKGAVLRRGVGLEVDVHRAFADGPFGLSSRPEELFASAEPFVLNGIELPALCAVDRFVNACFHVALSGHLRLSSVRDVAQLALVTHLDMTAVRERFRAWNADAVLARAITLTWRILGIRARTELTEWSERFEYDKRARRALAASTGSRAGWNLIAIEGVGALPSARLKAAYLQALVWPSRDFIDAMNDRRGRRWIRAGSALRSWLSAGRPH